METLYGRDSVPAPFHSATILIGVKTSSRPLNNDKWIVGAAVLGPPVRPGRRYQLNPSRGAVAPWIGILIE
jgi:hypothetical protein